MRQSSHRGVFIPSSFEIGSEELRQSLRSEEEKTVLDVRRVEKHKEIPVENLGGSVLNTPFYMFSESIPEEVKEQIKNLDSELLVLCNTGNKSDWISKMIRDELGVTAKNVKGGMESWFNHCVEKEMPLKNGKLVQYRRPSTGCISYMVKSSGESAVIDPLRHFNKRYIEDSEKLKFAIDTHIHADHVSGVMELAKREGTTGILPKASKQKIKQDERIKLLGDREVIEAGDVEIKPIHTPGHTKEMTCYLIGGEVLISGDSLLANSVARPDLGKDDKTVSLMAEKLYESLHQEILNLGEDIEIPPSHFKPSEHTEKFLKKTLREVKDQIRVVQLDKPDFIKQVTRKMPEKPANYRQILDINCGKAEINEEKILDTEIGPNNCAALD